MSVTVDLNGITMVRTGVPSTYILSLHSLGSSGIFYKIGRTKNLPNRISSLLSIFNDGRPKGVQGFPAELVGVCVMDAIGGGCDLGPDCFDSQYELVLGAHLEGDVELDLHKRFAHLRLRPDDLHRRVTRSEWFQKCWDDEDEYPRSIDAYLEQTEMAS